ncbi:MAG: ABC transporter ATPase [archaeon]
MKNNNDNLEPIDITEKTIIYSVGEKENGVSYNYVIKKLNNDGDVKGYQEIHFERNDDHVDIDGIHNEDLLKVVLDRLYSYQNGDLSSKQVDITITKLEEALMWMNKRTEDRIKRGVKGFYLK